MLRTNNRSMFMALYPSSNIFLLPRDNIHRFVSVVEIVPPRALVRRVSRPDHFKLVNMLRLWSPNSTVCPRRRTDIRAAFLEAIHCRTDNSLRYTVSWHCTTSFFDQETYLEISVLVGSAGTAQVWILFIFVLPVIPCHAEFFQKQGLSYLDRPLACVLHICNRKLLRLAQIYFAGVVHIVDAPVLCEKI